MKCFNMFLSLLITSNGTTETSEQQQWNRYWRHAHSLTKTTTATSCHGFTGSHNHELSRRTSTSSMKSFKKDDVFQYLIVCLMFLVTRICINLTQATGFPKRFCRWGGIGWGQCSRLAFESCLHTNDGDRNTLVSSLLIIIRKHPKVLTILQILKLLKPNG